MDIKIPSAPPGANAVDGVKEAAESVEGAEGVADSSQASRVDTDAISRIGERVAAGELDRGEAVRLILAEVLDSETVRALPQDLGEDLVEVLEALIETDPRLASLVSFLGPGDQD